MDIRAQLLTEHSRANTAAIALWAGSSTKNFKALLHLFLHEEYRVVQRAAWVISVIAAQQPELVKPHLKKMVQRMTETGLPSAVRRNVLRLLQHISIPKALHGQVMNTCFDFLADPKEDIAVRCFSMTVLGNLSRLYPEITPELSTIITDQLEHGASAGFRSRAARTLKLLQP